MEEPQTQALVASLTNLNVQTKNIVKPTLTTLPAEIKIDVLMLLAQLDSPQSFYALVASCKCFKETYENKKLFFAQFFFKKFVAHFGPLAIKVYNVETLCQDYSETEESYRQKALTPLPEHPTADQYIEIIKVHQNIVYLAHVFYRCVSLEGFASGISITDAVYLVYFKKLCFCERYYLEPARGIDPLPYYGSSRPIPDAVNTRKTIDPVFIDADNTMSEFSWLAYGSMDSWIRGLIAECLFGERPKGMLGVIRVSYYRVYGLFDVPLEISRDEKIGELVRLLRSRKGAEQWKVFHELMGGLKVRKITAWRNKLAMEAEAAQAEQE